MDGRYLEPGGSWRSFWLVAAVLAVLAVCDAVLPGPDVPPLLWVVAGVLTLGCVAAGCLSTRAPARLTEAILTAHPAGGTGTAGPGRVAP